MLRSAYSCIHTQAHAFPSCGANVGNTDLPQILPAVITAVERGGALLAAECVRPGGRR